MPRTPSNAPAPDAFGLRRVLHASLAVLVVVLTALGASACGDDSDDSGSDTARVSDGVSAEEEFCNSLRILIDATAEGELLDPETSTPEEVSALNQEVGGDLSALGIAAQGAEIDSPELDAIFEAQVPLPQSDADITPQAIREFQAALRVKMEAGETLQKETC